MLPWYIFDVMLDPDTLELLWVINLKVFLTLIFTWIYYYIGMISIWNNLIPMVWVSFWETLGKITIPSQVKEKQHCSSFPFKISGSKKLFLVGVPIENFLLGLNKVFERPVKQSCHSLWWQFVILGKKDWGRRYYNLLKQGSCSFGFI